MAGRWSDEYRERDWRAEDDWRDRDRERWSGSEERSFGREDRVFGERDTGASYNRPGNEGGYGEGRYGGGRYGEGGYGGSSYGDSSYGRASSGRSTYGGSAYGRSGYGGSEYGGRPAWQDRDYQGVSPAMQRGDYEAGYRSNPSFQSQDYTRGGRYYGDDARGRIYREEYGQGGRDYGPSPRGYDEGRRFGSREADDRWSREMRRPVSGGTGGYDYERGYGDGGRYGRDEGRWEDRGGFEGRAHDAGDFFRRTGEKVKSWFGDTGHDDERDYREHRGARGMGPKGYKRPDERISEEAHQRLTDDPWVDASEISCSVSGGEVTLSGTVENREAKHRAERIVEDLSGVNHVQNNLRIKAGNFLTSPGRGYGDSAQDAHMRHDPLKDATDGTAQTAQGIQQARSNGDDESAATRTTTRRT